MRVKKKQNKMDRNGVRHRPEVDIKLVKVIRERCKTGKKIRGNKNQVAG